jgi:hypothetical protein
LTGGGPLLPAWPVRAACESLADPGLATGDPWALLQAFEAAGSVFNNATQDIACYDVPTDYWLDGIWDYQWCTETIPEESYFTTDGVNDMQVPRRAAEPSRTGLTHSSRPLPRPQVLAARVRLGHCLGALLRGVGSAPALRVDARQLRQRLRLGQGRRHKRRL